MTLAILLLNLLPGLLKGMPGISEKIQQIVADVAGSTSAVLGSGVISAPSVNTVLAAWAGVIAILRSDPQLPQDKLAVLDQLAKAVQAALVEDAEAAKLVDWTKIAPIANV